MADSRVNPHSFNEKATLAAIAAFSEGADAKAIRAEAVRLIGIERDRATDQVEKRFLSDPTHAQPTTAAIAALTDGIVRTVYTVACNYLHYNPAPTKGEALAVIAVGGYGRAEMAPHSDVDLLFLSPWKLTSWAESAIESMLYMLWDLKLKVGHSSRTIRDCLRLGSEDYTIRTSLLELRHICGDPDMTEDLREQLWKDLFRTTAPDFIEAKLAEREARHKKQGGQRYMVEPNVKEAKGGLRDLQSLFWIAKYIHRVGSAAELVSLGLFTADEFETFSRAEDFLWAVRCHLHLITGRANDQLTFDLQVIVAERMGYKGREGRREVEMFMQDYFRHATQVGELTRIFLTAMEAQHLKKEPLLAGLFKRKKKLKQGYVVKQGRLAIANDPTFLDSNINLLHIF